MGARVGNCRKRVALEASAEDVARQDFLPHQSQTWYDSLSSSCFPEPAAAYAGIG